MSNSAVRADADVERFNVFDFLRQHTADLHQLIERRVPVFREGFTLEDYARLVEQFFGFWTPVEDKLSNLRSLRDPDLALHNRLKCSLLRQDLLILGRDPAAVRQCEKIPRLDTFMQGLGCLYVLEGSTLGSQIISRHLKEKLQLGEGTGASFFNAYGGLTGARWIEFKGFVSAFVKSEDADTIVEAARSTFLCFYEWLGTDSGPSCGCE
jgi:heme oxygenase (biliverdin-IX-beta and delta-forming)